MKKKRNIPPLGVRNKREPAQRMPDVTHSHQERRKYPRLKKHLIVRFRKVESMEQCGSGATEDIGMGGFRADVAFFGKPLTVDQTIEVYITEPPGEGEPIKAVGRIAWIKEKEDEHSHEIGVMLTHVNKEDTERFMKYFK